MNWQRYSKLGGSLVLLLLVFTATLITTVGVCSQHADRSRYQVVLTSLHEGARLSRAIRQLEEAHCFELNRRSGFVSYQCLPYANAACRFAPTMVDIVDLHFVDGLVTSVEVYDALSILPKPLPAGG